MGTGVDSSSLSRLKGDAGGSPGSANNNGVGKDDNDSDNKDGVQHQTDVGGTASAAPNNNSNNIAAAAPAPNFMM